MVESCFDIYMFHSDTHEVLDFGVMYNRISIKLSLLAKNQWLLCRYVDLLCCVALDLN